MFQFESGSAQPDFQVFNEFTQGIRSVRRRGPGDTIVRPAAPLIQGQQESCCKNIARRRQQARKICHLDIAEKRERQVQAVIAGTFALHNEVHALRSLRKVRAHLGIRP